MNHIIACEGYSFVKKNQTYGVQCNVILNKNASNISSNNQWVQVNNKWGLNGKPEICLPHGNGSPDLYKKIYKK
jgi:hypothetical protein